jgi:GMP synthase-like glutamine amidotransferase
LRLHFIQHVPPENPGSILIWAKEKGHSVTHTIVYENEKFPDLQGFDWLVVMGGPMNIYEEEEHPWLADEKELINRSIAAGKVVLGFCLGSQLIADVIGGKVTPNFQPEIGWMPIRWNERARADALFSFFPAAPIVFHWHYDTFSVLPREAEVLAESTACSHQAFVFRERVFGFQFHLENTSETLQGLIAGSGGNLVTAAFVQSPEEVMGHPELISQNNRWLAEFLTRLEERERRSSLERRP